MQAILVPIFVWFADFIARKLLKTVMSLGVAFVTYDFLQGFIDKYMANAINSLSMTGDLMALVNIARLDECISIVVAGLTLRVMLMSLGVKAVKSK